MSWRLILEEAAPGAHNMAVDEALTETVRASGVPVLRLYGWSPPCLSFGRNQPARGHFDADSLGRVGIEIVRRPTGGRAVLHDRELTYAVVAPDRLLGTPRNAYRAINEVLVRALERIGASAEIHTAPDSPGPALDTEPCFADPADGELVAEGRKVVGSAQVRLGGVILQHGSIPLSPSPLLAKLPAPLARMLDGAPAFLQGISRTPPTWGVLTGAIEDAWTEAIGPLNSGGLAPAELQRVAELRRRYEDDEWTWRR